MYDCDKGIYKLKYKTSISYTVLSIHTSRSEELKGRNIKGKISKILSNTTGRNRQQTGQDELMTDNMRMPLAPKSCLSQALCWDGVRYMQ